MIGNKRRKPGLSLVVFCQFLFFGRAFLVPKWKALAVRDNDPTSSFKFEQQSSHSITTLSSSSSSSSTSSGNEVSSQEDETSEGNGDKNSIYVGGLMENLGSLCDKYICTGSPKTVRHVILYMWFHYLD